MLTARALGNPAPLTLITDAWDKSGVTIYGSFSCIDPMSLPILIYSALEEAIRAASLQDYNNEILNLSLQS